MWSSIDTEVCLDIGSVLSKDQEADVLDILEVCL